MIFLEGMFYLDHHCPMVWSAHLGLAGEVESGPTLEPSIVDRQTIGGRPNPEDSRRAEARGVDEVGPGASERRLDSGSVVGELWR